MGKTGRKKRLGHQQFRGERLPKKPQKDEDDPRKKQKSAEEKADHEERIRGSKSP